jgi:hypothetical protein
VRILHNFVWNGGSVDSLVFPPFISTCMQLDFLPTVEALTILSLLVRFNFKQSPCMYLQLFGIIGELNGGRRADYVKLFII